ncbi:MAG: YiiX/YebB-like N1pC/P60 family cysteine hydrolase, partial [Anaerolineae bacterium]|nr:YiiX/YebB-like N1pC/P60 family cysteine hydrolase [Anaerolineae bacterium]
MMWRMSRFVALLILLVAAAIPSAVHAGSSPPIDLQKDADRDGIPDALAMEVSRIAYSPDPTAAIASFVNRLPYSPRTRALQQEAERLQAQMAKAKSDEEARQILEKMRALSEEMMADPNYARTIQSLTALLVAPDARKAGGFPVKTSEGMSGGTVSTSSVNWGSLQRGDIMLVRSGLWDWFMFIYAMWYSHAGNYDGNGLVYESNADGVRLKPLSKWQQPGQYIGLGRNNKRSADQVQAALDWAKGFYGTDGQTPYNYFYPDKWTDSRLYCSQLTWKIHNRLGVDVDSNAWPVSYTHL